MDQKCPLCERVAPGRETADADFICDFEYSVAFLGRWQLYRGYTVLVTKAHATELSQLPDSVRHGFFDEMCRVARAIETAFKPNKLNYEILGNQVPHLHWHVFPRYADDQAPRQPVWQAIARAEQIPEIAEKYETPRAHRDQVIQAIRSYL